MAYDPTYFKGKKEELDKKFFTAKDQLIQDMFTLLNRFSEHQKDLQGRYAELIKTEDLIYTKILNNIVNKIIVGGVTICLRKRQPRRRKSKK